MNAEPVAVIDAAIAYGAQRYFDGVHRISGWPYASSYDEYDDKLLYLELLHYIFTYDRILLDKSSATAVGEDLVRFMDRVNSLLGFEWIKTTDLGGSVVEYPLDFVQSGVCRLVSQVTNTGVLTRERMETIPIPWAYKTTDHHDYASISARADRFGVPRDLVPFTLFLWRGLVYSAFAAYQARAYHRPCAYVAAPGRLMAMRAVLSRAEIRRAEYPREALNQLLYDLPGLPRGGFDFSLVTSPFERSPLSAELAELPGQSALQRAIDVRARSGDLRRKWAYQLFGQATSCAVGSTYSQSVQGTVVHGDLTQIQIVHAVPCDE